MRRIGIAAILLCLGAAAGVAQTDPAPAPDLNDPEVVRQILARVARAEPGRAEEIYRDLIGEAKAKELFVLRRETCLALYSLVHEDIGKKETAALFDDCAEDQRRALLGLSDRAPFVVALVLPRFDRQELKLRGVACAVADFSISSRGRARDIELSNLTHRDLERPVRRALRQSRFAPGIENGRKVAAGGYRLQYFFTIEDSDRSVSLAFVRTVISDLERTGDPLRCHGE